MCVIPYGVNGTNASLPPDVQSSVSEYVSTQASPPLSSVQLYSSDTLQSRLKLKSESSSDSQLLPLQDIATPGVVNALGPARSGSMSSARRNCHIDQRPNHCPNDQNSGQSSVGAPSRVCFASPLPLCRLWRSDTILLKASTPSFL
jgi:hypothetical protein